MTVSSTTNRVSASGNGSTTAFAFGYPYRAASDLRVILKDNTTLVETLQTINTDYTLVGVPNANTGGFDSGTVTFVTAPASGKTVIVNRAVPLTSSYDPTAGGADTAPSREGAIDRLTLQVQMLREMLARVPILPEGNLLTDLQLPNVRSSLAGNLLAINATGDGYTAVATSTLSVGQAVSAFAATLLDDTSAADALTTLGLSTFIKTLMDDADAPTARNTLGIRECLIIAVSDETTAITTGTAKVTFRMPYAFTLSEIPRASLATASSSGAPQVDINQAGSSILSTKLTIDANEKTSTTAATAAVLSDSTLDDDAEITIDIDTAGTGAKGLKVYLIGYKTA